MFLIDCVLQSIKENHMLMSDLVSWLKELIAKEIITHTDAFQTLVCEGLTAEQAEEQLR